MQMHANEGEARTNWHRCFLRDMQIHVAKKNEQVSVRMTPEVFEGLKRIKDESGIEPSDLLRRCADAAIKFHKAGGTFDVPLKLSPDVEYLQKLINTHAVELSAETGQPQKSARDYQEVSAATGKPHGHGPLTEAPGKPSKQTKKTAA